MAIPECAIRAQTRARAKYGAGHAKYANQPKPGRSAHDVLALCEPTLHGLLSQASLAEDFPESVLRAVRSGPARR